MLPELGVPTCGYNEDDLLDVPPLAAYKMRRDLRDLTDWACGGDYRVT